MDKTGRELRSIINRNGTLVLSLKQVRLDTPGDDEVLVRVEATPLNPSDIGLMLGPGDLSRIEPIECDDEPGLMMPVPPAALAAVAGRLGQSLPLGHEGAGTVVAAGKGATGLLGRRVAMFGGAMYADYRRISADSVIALPDDASSAEGASMFINPMTALGFVETARREGHRAVIHTPAASNLGQMLQRICSADGIPLINIVRSEEQATLLRNMDATYVLNSAHADFPERLTDLAAETGATIAFDAIGGGSTGSTILQAMERAALRGPSAYNRYGSEVFKQLYIYGSLDRSPTVLDRSAIGNAWGVSAWLLFHYFRRSTPYTLQRMRHRIRNELRTTFASHYTRTVGLGEVLNPETLRALERKATGTKYLIDPRMS